MFTPVGVSCLYTDTLFMASYDDLIVQLKCDVKFSPLSDDAMIFVIKISLLESLIYSQEGQVLRIFKKL